MNILYLKILSEIVIGECYQEIFLFRRIHRIIGKYYKTLTYRYYATDSFGEAGSLVNINEDSSKILKLSTFFTFIVTFTPIIVSLLLTSTIIF